MLDLLFLATEDVPDAMILIVRHVTRPISARPASQDSLWTHPLQPAINQTVMDIVWMSLTDLYLKNSLQIISIKSTEQTIMLCLDLFS